MCDDINMEELLRSVRFEDSHLVYSMGFKS